MLRYPRRSVSDIDICYSKILWIWVKDVTGFTTNNISLKFYFFLSKSDTSKIVLTVKFYKRNEYVSHLLF